MIVEDRGIKKIINKVFKKKTFNFDEKINSSNNTRKKLYEYISNVSGGDSKLISIRYELLYAEYCKATKINLQQLAKNRNIKTIEMAVELDKNNNTNHLNDLYLLAKKLFKEGGN